MDIARSNSYWMGWLGHFRLLALNKGIYSKTCTHVMCKMPMSIRVHKSQADILGRRVQAGGLSCQY